MSKQTDRIWQSAEVAQGYLEGVRGAIPLATEQLDVMMRVIRSVRPDLKTFLDIGCGDGILGHTLLTHYPDAHGILLDFSEPMLTAAQHKLVASRMQLQFLNQDYGKSAWTEAVQKQAPFDAIVSGFSIHHQPDSRKQKLYSEIFNLLKPGGIFINIEHVAPDNKWNEELFSELFIDSLIDHNQQYQPNIGTEETERRFRKRDDQFANILTPLDLQLSWMQTIGYEQVACYLEIFELAVFGGIRPDA